jgi:formate transporter
MDGIPNQDSLLPPEIAEKTILTGINKANSSFGKLFLLAILAGMFIAIGGVFSTSVTAGTKDIIPFGIIRLIAGFSFSAALMMVIIAGAELFTGNMLMVMAYFEKKATIAGIFRNWLIVYLGNFIGSILMAGLIFLGKQFTMGSGSVGLIMLSTAEAKTAYGFWQALVLGILCNFLVCIAVWMASAGKTNTDKILAIIPPISAFVAAGFEHSVANMYYIPVGLLVKGFAGDSFFSLIHKTPADFPHLTWGNFLLGNLLPVTLGNIIGGALLVGVIYWFVYLRGKQS